MEEDLISKKDLLESTGISYGQLYRWKRKELIPEDWFIRKSTFTGQETFFPKEQMLSRVNKIQSLKDDLSLDSIADLLSPSPSEIILTKSELINRKLISETALAVFAECLVPMDSYSFDDIFKLFLLDKGLQTGDITVEDGKSILKVMDQHDKESSRQILDIVLLRKMGVTFCMLVSSNSTLYHESDAKQCFRMNLTQCIEELKGRLF
ncbi:YhbD family protein [Metabacillus sp. RGM 3146]|uniref:YhbD family protein n=1 Tax=Metabacillus sp. RGM 3146 TaxID=3401092 RepID=UPI003B991299